MSRRIAAAVLACLAIESSTAACVPAQAAAPFPVVPLETAVPRPHTWSYVTMGTGVALIAGSFLFGGRADDTYDAYLEATDPARIEQLYDRTVLYDRAAQASLLGGEALVATGLWMRFLRRPQADGFTLDLRPDRCALSLRF